jgi:Glycosyl transferase family 2
MTKPTITVAMATYDDFHGVFFTVQSLRLYQNATPEWLEIVVLDNNPGSVHGNETRSLLASLEHVARVKYVPFEGSVGTTQTRERLFAEASGDIVVVLDCHVLLVPGALTRLRDYFEGLSEEESKNLFTGPLLLDSLNFVQTHFECGWRGQMWGTWATAWKNKDGRLYVLQQSATGTVEIKALNTPGPWVDLKIHWANHEQQMRDWGYTVHGLDPTDEPFEVPAQGLGMFISARKHWLGFNPHFKSFGGEECYIHEKYRQAGRKTVCLPFMQWNHRFGRPDGPRYPITVEGKMRNYILGFQELGLPIEEVRHHFVDEIHVRQDVFDYAMIDPINYVPGQLYANDPSAQNGPIMFSNLGMPVPVAATNYADIKLALQRDHRRDLDQHAEVIAAYASRCDSVLEFTKRRESTAFLLAGLTSLPACSSGQCESTGCSGACNRPVRFVSYHEEHDTLLDLLQDLAPTAGDPRRALISIHKVPSLDEVPTVEEPDDFDLLFIDTRHNGARLKQELDYVGDRIQKYIVVHDTSLYGMSGDDGTPRGLLFGLREWVKEHPEWYVAYTTQDQYGLTILSKVEDEKPIEAIKAWPCMNAEGGPCGAGTNVKASLALLGIVATEGCSCNAKASTMDYQGPQWCRDNIELIVDWMKEEAEARQLGYMFFRPATKLMVSRAIRKAEKDLASGRCY